MPDTQPERQSLRQLIRQRRKSLSQAEQQAAAQQLVMRFQEHPEIQGARRIALYLANDGEIDPGWLLRAAQRRGKITYLPVLSAWPKTKMVFQRINPQDKLRRNRFRIAEPLANRARQRKVWALDLILLPLVGFDAHGGRLGMGGGFYDRSLAHKTRHPGMHKPRLLGLAHECQKVEKLPTASWDVPLQATVTDQGWYGVARRPG